MKYLVVFCLIQLATSYGPIPQGSTQRRTTTPFPPGVQPSNQEYSPETNSISPEPSGSFQQVLGSYNFNDNGVSGSGSFSGSSSGNPAWWSDQGQKPVPSSPDCNVCAQAAHSSLSSSNSKPETPAGIGIKPDNPWLSSFVQQNSVPSASVQRPTQYGGYGGSSNSVPSASSQKPTGYGGYGSAPTSSQNTAASNQKPTSYGGYGAAPSSSNQKPTGYGGYGAAPTVSQNNVPSASNQKPSGYGGYGSSFNSASSSNQKPSGYGGYGAAPSSIPSNPLFGSSSQSYGSVSGSAPKQPCNVPGKICVPSNLCRNGKIVQDGSGIFNTRSGSQLCSPSETCCQLEKQTPDYQTQASDGPSPSQVQLNSFNKQDYNPGQNGIPIGGSIYDSFPSSKPTSAFPVASTPNIQRPTSGYGAQPQRPASGYGAQPQRPASGYGAQPTTNIQRPGAGYGAQPRPQQPTFGSGSDQSPNFLNGPQNPSPTPGPFRPYTGPLNTTPHPGCAAALKCVQEIFCTSDGVMSDAPVYLTREESENRVPLSECLDIESGLVGKCCRDPNYTDPWPAGMMMNKPHDDGQYHGDQNQQGTTADICGPTATCIAAYECSADRQVQPVKDCQVPRDGSTGVCCSPNPLFPQGSNNQQVNTLPDVVYPSTSPLTPTQQYYTPGPSISNNPFLPENEGKFPIPQEPIRKTSSSFPRPQLQPFPNEIPVSTEKDYNNIGKQSTPQPEPFESNQKPIASYPSPPSRPQTGYGQAVSRPQTGYPQAPRKPQIGYGQAASTAQPSYPQPPSRPQIGYSQPSPKPQTTQVVTEIPTSASTIVVTTADYVSQTQPEPTPTTPSETPSPESTTEYQTTTVSVTKKQNQGLQEAEFGSQSQTPRPEVIYTPQPFPISENVYPGTEDKLTPNRELLPPTEDDAPVVNIPQTKPTKTRPKAPTGGYPSFDRKKTTPPSLIRSTTELVPEVEPGKECGVRRQVSRPNGPAGIETGFGEFPWQVQVLLANNQSVVCGGALLSENIVVTAAHCLNELTSTDLIVKAGDWKMITENPAEEPKPVQIRYVDAIARHPKYDQVSQFNDMAVLAISVPFKLDRHVDTLCIGDLNGDAGQRPSSNDCVVTGWGKAATQGNVPGSIMHSIPVKYIDGEQCEKAFRSTSLGKYFQLHRSFQCALPTNPNHDLCQIDVGSPIACKKPNGRYELSGIYSWDVGCHPNTNIPAASSSVDLQWVESCMRKSIAQLRQEENDEIQRQQNLGSLFGASDENKPGFSQGYGRK